MFDFARRCLLSWEGCHGFFSFCKQLFQTRPRLFIFTFLSNLQLAIRLCSKL